ncbi:MAG: hypothetical protein J7J01_01220 [Methanophagales archaeon]|nr:hypothetical protein [Methanophagales archaeon]
MTERELEKILDKLEGAKEVKVVTESAAHGESYVDTFGNLKTTAIFNHFLVIEIDGEVVDFKIESDEDWERAEEISNRIVHREREVQRITASVERGVGRMGEGCFAVKIQ